MIDCLLSQWPSRNAPLSGHGMPVRPIPAPGPLGALAYEQQIADTGGLPTRENAHDWYNALVWLAYPRAKQVLNRLQVRPSSDPVGGNGRTRLRDALTLFDENGAILETTDPTLAEALKNHDWPFLFIRSRSCWGSAVRVAVFGHALFEKLESPRLDLCAHARVRLLPADCWQRLEGLSEFERRADRDAWLADDIEQGLRLPSDLSPLPVMGIPGWHSDNAHSDFYNNQRVFRARRAL